MKLLLRLKFVINQLRLWPHFFAYLFSSNRNLIKQDVARWKLEYAKTQSLSYCLLFFLSFYPEFRNVFYYRIGSYSFILKLFCPQCNTLYITTSAHKIKGGFFIQHGFATIISAESIGENCWINQQVTIGYSNKIDCPTLGNNVKILAGAKVIGGVQIGDNSIVGANCVVVKNVPANAVVVGIPARIVKLNGNKVDLPLV